MSVVGSKAAMGASERIVSMMPAHSAYLEGFGGGGAVLRRKRGSGCDVVLERNPETASRLRLSMPPGAHVVCGDFFALAPPFLAMPAAVVYVDPPYVMQARSSKRAYYEFELCDADHERLAAMLQDSKAAVLVSGYASSLYESLFRGWRTESFGVQTRGGPRLETVWMNFDPPALLHDARYVGRSFTDRQRVARRVQRMAAKVLSMPPGERCALFEAVYAGLHSYGGSGA